MPMIDARADEKAAAARASLRFVHDGHVVGLGTGSTAAFVVQGLGGRVRAGLTIRAIPTSVRTRELAQAEGIPLTTFDEVDRIDVTIDGADEIDPALNLIKGGGGALLREKIVASASATVVIVADSTKPVAVLGGVPLPLEIVPFAAGLIARRVRDLGALTVTLRTDAAGRPFITDEGHHIVDCRFPGIPDPVRLARALEAMPGVVEHGLFVGMADVVIVGTAAGVDERRRAT